VQKLGRLPASRHWSLSLHFNKGLAGAQNDVIAAARNTAINPAALDACALIICGASLQPIPAFRAMNPILLPLVVMPAQSEIL
jgi:hypothetical protein